MIQNWSCTIRGDRLHLTGVTFGHGDSDPYIVERAGDLMVVKVPGTTEWAELGRSEYHPTEWLLIRIGHKEGRGDCVVEIIDERMPGRQWHRAKKELTRKMKALHGGGDA